MSNRTVSVFGYRKFVHEKHVVCFRQWLFVVHILLCHMTRGPVRELHSFSRSSVSSFAILPSVEKITERFLRLRQSAAL